MMLRCKELAELFSSHDSRPTSFSKLSEDAQRAIVDAALTPDGNVVLVSKEVKDEVQRWADAKDEDDA